LTSFRKKNPAGWIARMAAVIAFRMDTNDGLWDKRQRTGREGDWKNGGEPLRKFLPPVLILDFLIIHFHERYYSKN
jgi:hypothetical protein